MGIREQLAAHDARFISVSGLINDIADEEGVTSAEVARLLILDGVLNHLQTRLKLHGHGGYSEGGDAAANFELENAICDGKAWLDDCAQNEFREGEPGFFRDEVAEALKVAGWRVPSTLAGQMAEVSKLPPTPRERPDLLPFVPRVNISLAEAADILREANGGEWWAALEDAVDSDQIKAGSWGAYRGEQPLSHSDIRAWCEAGGIVWPVPVPPVPAPATDEALRDALAESRAECEALREELARLKATARSNDGGAHLQIKGATFEKLVDIVINKFPNQYPDRSKVKLDYDVRPWMKDELKLPDRERHIFGKIIAEHFGLKD